MLVGQFRVLVVSSGLVGEISSGFLSLSYFCVIPNSKALYMGGVCFRVWL